MVVEAEDGGGHAADVRDSGGRAGGRKRRRRVGAGTVQVDVGARGRGGADEARVVRGLELAEACSTRHGRCFSIPCGEKRQRKAGPTITLSGACSLATN